MSIPLICETYSEARRLLIAGSDLAINDFRLERLLPQMRKSGEKVPVFARIADAIEKVIKSEKNKSPENLMELANLVSAVLYTQCETGLEGEIQDIDTLGLALPTNTPFRRLIPVAEALTEKGNGRLEVIREAYNEGIFKDIRLIQPLMTALEDNYAEIADLAGLALEGYGKKIVPVLKKSISFDGSKGHARRVDLLSKLSGGEEKDYYLEAIDKGSLEIRVSAIKALKDSPECEATLLELSKDRKKDIREAALLALSNLDSSAAVKRIIEAFSDKDSEIAEVPAKQCKSFEMVSLLLSEAAKCLEIILRSEKTFKILPKKVEPPDSEVIQHFYITLDCLEGKNFDEVFVFLKKCFEHSEHLNKFKAPKKSLYEIEGTLAETVANNIILFGTKEAYELLESAKDRFDNCLIGYAFESSILTRDPEFVYKNYSKYLKLKKLPTWKKIYSILNRYADFNEKYRLDEFSSFSGHHPFAKPKLKEVRLDSSWVNELIAIDEPELVCRLASPDKSACIGYYLSKKLDTDLKLDASKCCMVLGLIQAEYPKLTDIIIKLLDFNFKRKDFYINYYLNQLIKVLKFLPRESAQELETFAAGYDNEAGGRIFELAQYLKGKKD